MTSLADALRLNKRLSIPGLAVSGGSRSLLDQVTAIMGGTGALYDPSDLTSLYQSRTGGSTGAVDSVVGIMLDKKQMGGKTAAAFIAGQSNIWSNAAASFAGESSQVASGVYRIYSSVGANSYVANTLLLTADRFYEVKFTIDAIAVLGGGVRIQDSGEVFTTTGAKTSILRATHTTLFIKRNGVGVETDIQISNVQVREIPGNHALAPSDAARPILRVSSGLTYLDPDGVDDWMQVFPTLNLGEQWWHVGGWREDANTQWVFTRGTSFKNAHGFGASSVRTRNGADSGYVDLVTGLSFPATGVLTLEQASNASIAARWNGAAGVGAVDPFDTTDSGLALFSGVNSSYNVGLDGRFYGGAWDTGTLTAAERSIVERWVASKCGVSL